MVYISLGEKNPDGKKTAAGEMLFDLVSTDINYHEVITLIAL